MCVHAPVHTHPGAGGRRGGCQQSRSDKATETLVKRTATLGNFQRKKKKGGSPHRKTSQGSRPWERAMTDSHPPSRADAAPEAEVARRMTRSLWVSSLRPLGSQYDFTALSQRFSLTFACHPDLDPSSF